MSRVTIVFLGPLPPYHCPAKKFLRDTVGVDSGVDICVDIGLKL
jgi:hypothetical protein